MIPYTDFLVFLSRQKKFSLYLVGGSVRDYLRGVEIFDVDLATDGDPLFLAAELAKVAEGYFYKLNLDHATARVLVNRDNFTWQYDIAVLRGDGKSIEKDLSHRDFTINSMALTLEYYFEKGDYRGLILDPFGGQEDLRRGLIRLLSEKALHDDPLRLLRGVRLCSQLGFSLEDQTKNFFLNNMTLLSSLDGERFKIELGKLLERPSYQYIGLVEELGLLEELFSSPKKGLFKKARLSSSLSKNSYNCALQYLEKFFQQSFSGITWKDKTWAFLEENLWGGWNRKQILRLGAFLLSVFKPEVPYFSEHEALDYRSGKKDAKRVYKYTEKLWMSVEERKALTDILSLFLFPLQLFNLPRQDEQEFQRLFRELGQEAPGVLLFSLAYCYGISRDDSFLTINSQEPTPTNFVEYENYIYALLQRFLSDK